MILRTLLLRSGLAVALLAVPARAEDFHAMYAAILADHVRDGWVDYGALRSDPRLAQYCEILATTDPDSLPSDKDRLAFWINAYNAYTLLVVAERYPIRSVNDLHRGGLILGSLFKTTVWDKKLITIRNQKTSLSWIEHKVIRKQFADPRAHFALVYASRSSPPLRSEPYRGSQLDEQLEDQARVFLSDPARNDFDVEAREARLSKVFDWFSEDFGGGKESVLRYAARYLSPPVRQAIQADAAAWKVTYLKYDWELNDTATSPGSDRR